MSAIDDLVARLNNENEFIDAIDEAASMLFHQEELIAKGDAETAALRARVELLEAALIEVQQVACGEMQVADDDTEGMAYIYRRVSGVLAPQPPQEAVTEPETPVLSKYAQRMVASTKPSGQQGLK